MLHTLRYAPDNSLPVVGGAGSGGVKPLPLLLADGLLLTCRCLLRPALAFKPGPHQGCKDSLRRTLHRPVGSEWR